MRRAERWEARLEHWGRWHASTSAASAGVSAVYAATPRGALPRGDAVPPRLADALAIEALVRALEPMLQRALVAHYTLAGSLGERAAAAGMPRQRLADRVAAAHDALQRVERAMAAEAARKVAFLRRPKK